MNDLPYQVVNQVYDRVFAPNGQTTGQWTVTFQHPDGTRSEATFPESEYTPLNVHRVAMALSENIATIAGLPSTLESPQ